MHGGNLSKVIVFKVTVKLVRDDVKLNQNINQILNVSILIQFWYY